MVNLDLEYSNWVSETKIGRFRSHSEGDRTYTLSSVLLGPITKNQKYSLDFWFFVDRARYRYWAPECQSEDFYFKEDDN
jgi:hypothetical protein